MATNEAAAAKGRAARRGPATAPGSFLQRMHGLRRAQDDLRALDAKLEAKADALDARIESVRNGSIGSYSPSSACSRSC